MGDLREELIRLASEWEAEAARRVAGTRKRKGQERKALNVGASFERNHAARLRSLLASHPAPSPSVSRDAETCRERSNVGHGCRREAGHEGRHRDRHGNEWAAPSPRSEAESRPATCGECAYFVSTTTGRGQCCPNGNPAGSVYTHEASCSKPGPCRAPVPAESATRCTSDGTDLGRRTCDCPKHAATKGEEDGR